MGRRLVRGGFGCGLMEESRCCNLGAVPRLYPVLGMGPSWASDNLSVVGEMLRDGGAHVARSCCDGAGCAVSAWGGTPIPQPHDLHCFLSSLGSDSLLSSGDICGIWDI